MANLETRSQLRAVRLTHRQSAEAAAKLYVVSDSDELAESCGMSCFDAYDLARDFDVPAYAGRREFAVPVEHADAIADELDNAADCAESNVESLDAAERRAARALVREFREAANLIRGIQQ